MKVPVTMRRSHVRMAAIKPYVFKLVTAPIVRWAAHRALVGRGPMPGETRRGSLHPARGRRARRAAWLGLGERVGDVPPGRTLGNRMNLRLACLSLSVPRLLAGVGARDPAERLRRRLRMFLRFPFSPPGYRCELTPLKDGLAIDMHRCPVAEYLGAHAAADLCVGAWCNLDYGLAEMWNARLVRSTTLAGGGKRCDFQFHAEGARR